MGLDQKRLARFAIFPLLGVPFTQRSEDMRRSQ
jgi:hypothetical protein